MRYRISYLMDEIWERAVETALDGQTDHATVRNLTLDGAVKCVHGRLPPPSIFEKFQNLLHLSIANIGVSSLEQFPHLTNLQKLVLSDNRISSGLEFLVDAGLDSLRDLDLSNNRIHLIEDLAPLAQLRIVSLDLYECPVTRVKDYRARVFGLIKSLRYLDKMDAEGIERPESDDEEEDDDDEEEEEDEEDDPGSGEIDGEDHPLVNGHAGERDEVVDVDEDEESDADEEETEISRNGLNLNHQVNGFHVADVQDEDDDDDDDNGEYEEDNDSGEEEIDEEDGEDEAVVEVHEIDDSDEDVVAEDEDGDDSEEEVDNEDGNFAEPESTGRLTSTEGEIDGHEQGEDDAEEDDNGETGEEELALDDDDEEVEGEDEEDYGGGYLLQPVVHAEEDGDGSDMDPGNEVDDLEEDLDEEEDLVEDEDDDPLGAIELLQAPSSSHRKRKRGENVSDDDIDIDNDSSGSDSDEDGDGGEDDDDDDGDDDDDVL